MPDRIIYARVSDQKMFFITPAAGISIEAEMERILPPDALNAGVRDATNIPSDGRLSTSLTWDGIRVSLDRTKAQAEIRTSRNASLVILDQRALAAQRAKDTVAEAAVNTEAEMLRNIPQDADFTSGTDDQLRGLLDMTIV